MAVPSEFEQLAKRARVGLRSRFQRDHLSAVLEDDEAPPLLEGALHRDEPLDAQAVADELREAERVRGDVREVLRAALAGDHGAVAIHPKEELEVFASQGVPGDLDGCHVELDAFPDREGRWFAL